MFAIFGPNSEEWIEIHYALAYCGFTTIPLTETLDAERIIYILEATRTRAVFCTPKLLSMLKTLIPNHRVLLNQIEKIIVFGCGQGSILEGSVPFAIPIITLEELKVDHSELLFDPVQPAVEHPVMIMYTSGSTGHPKGAILHDTLCTQNYQKVSGLVQSSRRWN